jgi:rhodanese-related sulfurtransferase
MQHITASELAAWMSDASRAQPLLLDVREPWEYQTCHIEGATLIPMNTIPARQEELDPESTIICICHHGARSAQVGAFLERGGFTNVTNLTGGIHAWALQVDNTMATY